MSQNTHTLEGLPKQLMMLLGTIVDNNVVNNWNIYQNINNQTCVTIRFNDSAAIEPVYYRRVSEKQARRNLDRAANYSNNIHNATTSAHKDSPTAYEVDKINTCTALDPQNVGQI
jgi:hypothetical protein